MLELIAVVGAFVAGWISRKKVGSSSTAVDKYYR